MVIEYVAMSRQVAGEDKMAQPKTEHVGRQHLHELPIGSSFQYQPHGPKHILLKLKGTQATETCSPGCTSTLWTTPSNTRVIPLT